MIFPGTAPAGYGFGGRGYGPQDLEQRKQALLQQMTASGGSTPSTLSFGGSTGDAAARLPGLSWNPFLEAQQSLFGLNNAGQQGNAAVSAQPFFGGGAPGGGSPQNAPGNGTQAAQVFGGAPLGGATQSTQPAQPGGISNPGFNNPTMGGAGRMDFGGGSLSPYTIQQITSWLASNPQAQAPTGGLGNFGMGRYV